MSAVFAGKLINLTELSRSTGLSRPYLSRIVSGHREPSLVTARRIATAMGMTMEQFLLALDSRTTTDVGTAA